MLWRVNDILMVYSVHLVVNMSCRQEGDFRDLGYEFRLQKGFKDKSMVSEKCEIVKTDRGCP